MTHLEATQNILGDLIAYPTISADSNLELIAYCADYLEELGARVTISTDATGTKANLFAGLGPDIDGGIVLSGHSDVVPVAGQDWSSDPFEMVERDGKLFGRGACDMKGFLAATLALAPDYAALELKRPVHFAFTYDEEVGCLGGKALVAELQSMGLRPAAAIIGEPTSMRVIEGHKGCYEYTTEFSGLEGHGSLPHLGVNAVEYAVRYISRLMDLREELKNSTPKASRFVPPYSTIQVGRINGGVAHNVIAGDCSVDWEFRPVQKSDSDYVEQQTRKIVEDELLPAMQAIHVGANITTRMVGGVEGLELAAESEARATVMELTGSTQTDVVSFGTEAGLFQDAGISAVICGPGSIEQAHKADEFVSLEQLQACILMLDGLKSKLV
jgi:acetylornithine deacetylase